MKIKYDEYLDGDMPKKDIFKAGAQSRQAEIDELQKRIDEALTVLQQMKHNGAYRATYILKGQNND